MHVQCHQVHQRSFFPNLLAAAACDYRSLCEQNVRIGVNLYKNKTALILGADTAAGRATALKFSRIGARVLLAGYEHEQLALLSRLILDKRGDPLEVLLPESPGGAVAVLREKRKSFGHVHAVVNAVAASAFTGEDRVLMIERARELNQIALDLVQGAGSVRLCTVWPDDAGKPPVVPHPFWHTLVHVTRIASAGGTDDPSEERSLKPAAVADTVLALMSCEGGACPVEVRLEPRRTKA
jgi:hypothetical protein